VNIGSEQVLQPASHNALYGATKAALVYLTRSWASELAADGVRVNCLLPGAVDTDMLYRSVAPGQVGVPLGRLVLPSDVAGWTMTLLGSDMTTGAIVTIDGGTSL
jgi:NAD(P)-dependent dehydrogenase (short-subunit alcohol dehydrogenase family)